MKEKVNVLAKKLKPYSIPGAITLAVVLITLILKEIWPFGGNRIDYFDNMLPAACRRFDCFQIGEPATHEDGKALYPTFKKIAPDVWEYCGNHIRGEK